MIVVAGKRQLHKYQESVVCHGPHGRNNLRVTQDQF